MALALLPENEIKDAYQQIKIEGSTLFENTRFETNLKNFFQYFEKEWLDGIYKISEWCVFAQRHRKNNYLESYHNQLKVDLGLRPSSPNF